jgi:hypothetical protein
MRDVLDCGRAEELFSDYRDGLLTAPLRGDLERHLASCPRCPDVLAAIDDVLDVLRAPLDVDPSASLAARVAAASWKAARTATVVPIRRVQRLPAQVQALAAGLAVCVTSAVLLLQQTAPPDPGRVAGRVKERTVNAAIYVQERGVRLLEDLRMLRVVIATAFEGRIERVNDRVDDYKRLLEKRRQHTSERRESQVEPTAPRSALHLRTGPRSVS